MFSCCTSRDREADAGASEYERKILNLTGMKEGTDYRIYDQKLPNSKGHIHTIEAGFLEKPPSPLKKSKKEPKAEDLKDVNSGKPRKQQIVLVHGYGATGVFYYKMIEELRNSFHVFAIDMWGFGQSSRPKISDYSFENCCSFFLEPFEEWRKSLELEDFVLVAHSMGAFLMSQYMKLKEPPVKMLYLISPAGFTIKTVDEIKERMSQYVSGFKMLTIKFSFFVMEDLRMSPFHLAFMNRDGAIEKYFKGERMAMNTEESTLFIEYFKKIVDQSACGEKALGSFLYYGCYSKNPLSKLFKKIRDDICNVRIFYGDADWMDFEHSIEVNILEKIKYDIQIVPNAGHQILLQNPSYLTKVLVEDLKSDYDPYIYFEQQSAHMKHSYLNLSKDVLKFLSKTATDLTMMRDN